MSVTSKAERAALEYALAKQVPDMESGCTIQTNYGDIRLDAEDGAEVASLVGRLLREKLLNAMACPLPPIELPIVGVINVDNPRDLRHKEWK
jgi:hypothetical protein